MFRRPACGPAAARRHPLSGSSKSITLRLIAGPEQPGGAGLTDLDSTEVFVW
jgi:hypothetical protein